MLVCRVLKEVHLAEATAEDPLHVPCPHPRLPWDSSGSTSLQPPSGPSQQPLGSLLDAAMESAPEKRLGHFEQQLDTARLVVEALPKWTLVARELMQAV